MKAIVVNGYRRILCPIDTSACSRAAVHEALALARRFGAELEVLHVHRVPAYVQPTILVWAAVGPRPLWELAEDQAKAEVEGFLSGFSGEDRAALRVSYEVGDAANVILERAKTAGVDLLVLGTHGRTGARRVVLGSVAERVVRLAPCPVLVVPMNAREGRDDGGRSTSERELK
ncbi:MAG: universal stress protein [Polyangiaceae bacterium]|nr:universal stress protein [Myxococcales bacterium]MCC6900135.1 universal stress protein [Polyangiaceae bacterium]